MRPAPERRVVAVSGLIMDQLHRSYGPGLAVDIIAPGVKLPSAADAAQRQAVRDRLGWDADTIGCLLVARNPLRKAAGAAGRLGAAARALPAAGGRGRQPRANACAAPAPSRTGSP